MSVMTTTASVTWDRAAYDQLTYFAFRPANYFYGFVDVKPTKQSTPGSSVIFNQTADLAVASTPLNESTDVNSVALSDTPITVTLDEYGNSVQRSQKLGATSYLPVDPAIANVIGQNAAETLDVVIRDIMVAGSNVRYGGSATSRNTVIPTATLTSAHFRRARADLVGASVPRWGAHYVAIVHPDQVYDLRAETDLAGWRAPHAYNDPMAIYNGTVETYEGFAVLESPRAKVFADAGSSTTLTDVYAALFFGRMAMCGAYGVADGYGQYPTFVAAPIIDKLRRFTGLGWKFFGGWARFREAALRRVETSSSIGTNA